jgi:HlyD family secretion protein
MPSPLDIFLHAPPPRPIRQRLSLALLALAGIAAAALFVRFWAGTDSPYYTAPLTRGDLAPVLSARGTLHGEGEVTVAAAQDGAVLTLPPEGAPRQGGASVSAGQALAEIDRTPLLRALATDRARLDELQGHLAQARITVGETQTRLERYERVWKRSDGRVPSLNEMEMARATAARARFDSEAAGEEAADAQAQVAADQTLLQSAETRAPFAGRVVARFVRPGEFVHKGQRLITLAPFHDRMTVVVPLRAADALRLQAGARARVLVDGLSDSVSPARLLRIEPVPVTDPVVDGEDRLAIFALEQASHTMQPGMRVTTEIDLPFRRNVLLAPDSAISFCKREAGWACIALLDHGREARRVHVSVGGGNGARSEVIAAGLEAGAQAIIGWRHSPEGRGKDTTPHATP